MPVEITIDPQAAAQSFSAWLAGKGIDSQSIGDGNRAALESIWRTESNAAFPELPTNLPANLPAGLSADAQAIQELRSAAARCRGEHPAKADAIDDCLAQAIEAGTPIKDFELQLLRTFERSNITLPSRSQAFTQSAPDSVHAAALLMSMGVLSEREAGKVFDERTMNAAVTGPNQRLSLHSLMRMFAARAGRPFNGTPSDDDIRAAFSYGQPMANGAGVPSTYSLPGILSNASNKAMLSEFNSPDFAWPKFCRQSSVPNFKAAKSYRLELSQLLQALPKNGEIEHGSMIEADYDRQAATKALMLGLDRVDIVNDDLLAFLMLPKLLARAAGVTLEKDVHTLLLSNPGTPKFFSTTNANHGGAVSLTASNMEIAWTKIMGQLDTSGSPIFVTPGVLLVPPALWATAAALTASLALAPSGDTDRELPTANIWAGKMEPVASPFLGAPAGLSGGSNAGWYVMPRPGDFSPIDVHFLNGRAAPEVSSNTFDFNRLGLSTRVVFDYGVSLLEPKGSTLFGVAEA